MFAQKLNKKLAILAVIILSVAGFFFVLASTIYAAASPDAIAIRVISNPQHMSALKWYESRGFSGSPQSLTVDGYEAVRDGRTVYVNAANIVDNNLYTNIYLISYNQDPENATVDIFSQILSHWQFNTNITEIGQCTKDAQASCAKDDDCQRLDKGYCQRKTGSNYVVKSEIVRDTRRLSDLADIKLALADYQKKQNGNYPSLSSGTYIPSRTISAWPSWQETLGKEMGVTLPLGPINQLGKCKSDDTENSKYNPATCWDENNKNFATTLPDLPVNSFIYEYVGSGDGSSYQICGVMESGLVTGMENNACPGSVIVGIVGSKDNHPPVISCGSLYGLPGNKFTGYISAHDPDGDSLRNWSIDTSGTDWTGWSAIPVIQSTAVQNQKKIYAAQGGNIGQYSFKVTVNDARGATKTEQCTITLGSATPQVDAIPAQQVAVGDNFVFTIQASETDKNYPLSFKFTVKDEAGNIVTPNLTCASTGESGGKYYCNISTVINYPVSPPSTNYLVTVTTADSAGVKSPPATFNLVVRVNTPNITALDATFPASSTKEINYSLTATGTGITSAVLTGSLLQNLTTSSNITGGILTFLISGVLNSNNVFNTLSTALNYAVTVKNNFNSNSSGNFNLNITNNPPTINTPLACPASIRANNNYSCTITSTDQEGNNIKYYNFSGLPNGLTGSKSGNNGVINGKPSTAGNYNVSVSATDEFSYTGQPASYDLLVTSYCGDGVKETPNTEKTGGPANDGNEACDGSSGVAVSPTDSSSSKQYSCASDCKFTGGYCGDSAVNTAEQCDFGANKNCCANCAWTCPPYSQTAMLFSGNASEVTLNSGDSSGIIFPVCRTFDATGVKVDAQLISVAIPTAIVYITDTSSSMKASMSEVISALDSTMDNLYSRATNGGEISVGLVRFSNTISTSTIVDINSSVNRDNLKGAINTYVPSGTTYTSSAVLRARQMLAASTATKKIMVLLSDGVPTVNYDPVTELNTAKGAGISVYTIAYTTTGSLKQTMCGWSSGTPCASPDYANTYAYASTDAMSVYDAITNNIFYQPSGGINIAISGGNFSFNASTTASSTISNIPISLAGTTCGNASQTLPFNINFSGGGKIRFFNAQLSYCAACAP